MQLNNVIDIQLVVYIPLTDQIHVEMMFVSHHTAVAFTAVALLIQNIFVKLVRVSKHFCIRNTAPFQARVIPFERGDQKGYKYVKK